MSALTIYLLILKATVTSFAGMGSLPQYGRTLSSRGMPCPMSS